MKDRTSLVYLLGAGRSGTTLMATVLNGHSEICTIGEMNQFVEHLIDKKECSCGESLNSCSFWKDIIENLSINSDDYNKIQVNIRSNEKHRNIPKLLLYNKAEKKYLDTQLKIFSAIKKQVSNLTLLDSSKYIARYLLLKRSNHLNIKAVYIVRDVRGVINSFNKQVQTQRKPLSTICYYLLINFFGQIVFWLDKDVIKVKYEDFIDNPTQIVNKIYTQVFSPEKSLKELPNDYQMPHIIGGNRMKSKKKIVIRKDFEWKTNISRPWQIVYYMLSFPIMILNKYKL